MSEATFEIKVSVEQKQAAAEQPAIIAKSVEEQRYILTVAYAADLPDVMKARDGHIDFASKAVVEQACWNFMAKGCPVGAFHAPGTTDLQLAEVVENYIYRGPDWVIKATDGTEQCVKEGDWMLGMILSSDAWDAYKEGIFGGVSPQGPARRVLKPSREKLAGLRSR